ncbi:MAG TPA: branched-chain amino acid ABC transporter permease [Burkholderiaceae bacterium]|nr:branched-chain amino acid ABC transporter permease [Burkholderiaceae bacterium]
MFYRENGQFKTSYSADQQLLPIAQDRWFLIALITASFVAVPLLASDYMLRALIIPFLILTIAAIGLNILVGFCGQISLGSAAFMGVGAYVAYNLTVRVPQLNFLLVLVLSGAAAAFVGSAFGIPSLRIKGLYLAVATLAAQFFLDWAFARLPWFTVGSPSGSVSTKPIELLGWTVDRPIDKYLLVLGLLCVLTLAAKNLTRSHIGRAWMATRDMDVAAEVIGVRPVVAKLSAFAVSSFYAGIAGALWGFVHLGSWEPAAFDVSMSLNLLFMIIIGGLGSMVGSYFGAAFFVLLPLLLNRIPEMIGVDVSTAMKSHMEAMIFGGLIVFFLAIEPRGLARLWAIGKEKLRIWPFPH